MFQSSMAIRNLVRIMLLLAVCVFDRSVQAQTVVPSEYQIKAAFLYNFSKFVDWSIADVNSDSNKHQLCIIGKNPFNEILDEIDGKPIKNKTMSVHTLSSLEQLGSCQVLFVGLDKQEEIRQIIASSQQNNILTVAEMSGFIEYGGIIELRIINGKVRFDINLTAARQSRLKISSRLLNLANKVYEDPLP